MPPSPTATRRAARALVALAAVVLLGVAAGAAPAGAIVKATDGTISGAAGTVPGFAGDGGPATDALLDQPSDVAFTSASSYLIADTANDRIRRVGGDGIITTVAGDGNPGGSGDGGSALLAELDAPRGVTATPDGGYLIADTGNDRIRKVAADGTITTFAGSSGGLSGDGGPAILAQLSAPSDTAVLPDGSVVIADTGNDRVREVSPDGTISTIAGTTRGFGGDGGPATAAQLDQPRDVTVLSDGSVAVADTGNDRVRRFVPGGTIATVAGTGTAGLSGDGDPATSARLDAPAAVAALPNGGFLVADTGNDRVRRVTPLGAIFTVAGSTAGNAGNGGLARNALLDRPMAVTGAPGGGFVVADTGNATVRAVSALGAVPPAVVGRSVGVSPDSGTVTVTPKGTAVAKPLREEDLVPVGSRVDATGGRLDLTVARDAGGPQQTAQLFSGPFTVRQGSVGRPYTEFRVPAPAGCPAADGRAHARAAAARAAGPVASAAKKKAKKKKKKRKVWVSEKGGHWKSTTGSSSASAIGTRWSTETFCDGSSRIAVAQGAVRVRDALHHRTVRLRAGQALLVAHRKQR